MWFFVVQGVSHCLIIRELIYIIFTAETRWYDELVNSEMSIFTFLQLFPKIKNFYEIELFNFYPLHIDVMKCSRNINHHRITADHSILAYLPAQFFLHIVFGRIVEEKYILRLKTLMNIQYLITEVLKPFSKKAF